MRDTHRSFGKNRAVAGVDLRLGTGAFGLPGRSEVALMSAGKIVFRGTLDELTARGAGHEAGDAPLERGYSAVLAEVRS